MQSACDLLLYRTYFETWLRGEKYVHEGRVGTVDSSNKEIQAKVRGSKSYEVKLKFQGDGISRNCSCPVRDFCKHMVAVAITWDEMRGLSRPTSVEVEAGSIPPPLVSHAEITEAFNNPLQANLDVIRLAVDDYALSPRPHARLPQKPKFTDSANDPLDLNEAQKAFSEIRRWSNRRNFDYYFCGGEMVAAFCEVMRLVMARLDASGLLEAAKILRLAQAFNYELILKIIDDSDGLHVFTEAHLDSLAEKIRSRLKKTTQDKEEISQLLKDYAPNLDNY